MTHLIPERIFKWNQMSPWLSLLNAACKWNTRLILILTTNCVFFLSEKGTKFTLLYDCSAEKSKVTKLCRIFHFLSCGCDYWGHFFQGRSASYSDKFSVIFSTNPITLLSYKACTFCCVNNVSKFGSFDISKISYGLW